MTRLAFAFLIVCGIVRAEGELRFAVHHEPKSLHPLLAADDASEALRYLASGSLIRVNRLTGALEPELAQSWNITPDSRSITFQLRPGISFSDGTPFGAADVVFTFAQLGSAALHPAVAESFSVGGALPKVTASGNLSVTVQFGSPVAGMERLFDQLSIVSGRSPLKERASLGPFILATYRPGVEILLDKNPKYWKKDAAGRQLPYLDHVRIAIQANREIELDRFRKGELDLINSLDPEIADRLAKEMPSAVQDGGPSTDVEFLWFNLAPRSPAPQYKQEWFRNVVFRQAVSAAINRDDLSRVVYRGHAKPAVGPFSSANRFWFNQKLAPHRFDPSGALQLLTAQGFQKKGDVLSDKAGHSVEFSLMTSAGNKTRERMAAMIQQDLQSIGIKLNLVTLDFSSLLDRLTKTSDYEACLLGLKNVDSDPNEMMNVLLSSGRQHAWNPAQVEPATGWEAEIDSLLRAQAASSDRQKRKQLFDQVQQILRREQPYIYLTNQNSLTAIGPRVKGSHPAAIYPQTFWNIESLSVK